MENEFDIVVPSSSTQSTITSFLTPLTISTSLSQVGYESTCHSPYSVLYNTSLGIHVTSPSLLPRKSRKRPLKGYAIGCPNVSWINGYRFHPHTLSLPRTSDGSLSLTCDCILSSMFLPAQGSSWRMRGRSRPRHSPMRMRYAEYKKQPGRCPKFFSVSPSE